MGYRDVMDILLEMVKGCVDKHNQVVRLSSKQGTVHHQGDFYLCVFF